MPGGHFEGPKRATFGLQTGGRPLQNDQPDSHAHLIRRRPSEDAHIPRELALLSVGLRQPLATPDGIEHILKHGRIRPPDMGVAVVIGWFPDTEPGHHPFIRGRFRSAFKYNFGRRPR